MKIQLLVLAGVLYFCRPVLSQTLSPSVISSSGAFYSNTAGMLSSTVGEMAMIETFSSGSVIITQGFQQPEDFNVAIQEISGNSAVIGFGPNPTGGSIQIVFNTLEATKLLITVSDLNGKIIHRENAEKSTQNNFIRLDLSALASGEYLIGCMPIDSDLFSFAEKITIVK